MEEEEGRTLAAEQRSGLCEYLQCLYHSVRKATPDQRAQQQQSRNNDTTDSYVYGATHQRALQRFACPKLFLQAFDILFLALTPQSSPCHNVGLVKQQLPPAGLINSGCQLDEWLGWVRK